MKYRVYRLRSALEYKDVEAEIKAEAWDHITDVKEDFKVISAGYISESWIDTDLSKEKELGTLRVEAKEEE